MRRVLDDQVEVQLERCSLDTSCVYVRVKELTTRRTFTLHLSAGEADELGACLAVLAAAAAPDMQRLRDIRLPDSSPLASSWNTTLPPKGR